MLLYIIGGTEDQVKRYARLVGLIPYRMCVDRIFNPKKWVGLNEYKSVSSPSVLRGICNLEFIKIGTWFKRNDIHEINAILACCGEPKEKELAKCLKLLF